MVFFGETWYQADAKAISWCAAFAHDGWDESAVTKRMIRNNNVCVVVIWEKKEATNG